MEVPYPGYGALAVCAVEAAVETAMTNFRELPPDLRAEEPASQVARMPWRSLHLLLATDRLAQQLAERHTWCSWLPRCPCCSRPSRH